LDSIKESELTKKINIAIDGHSSCGKSTLAKALAKSLNYIYIDSGAMYRAVALYCLENEIDPNNPEAVEAALDHINIEILNQNNQFRILLNNKNITNRIIQLDVSGIVSEIAAIPAVRAKLRVIQRDMGNNKGVVMDGRDIGSVVFPDAEAKLFVTAEVETRAQRRFLELKRKGMETPLDDVRSNLKHRDHIDSTRNDSPLMMVEDAVLINNTFMTQEEQLYIAQKIIADILKKIA